MRPLAILLLLVGGPTFGQQPVTITVAGGKTDEVNVPVCVPLQWDKTRAAEKVIGLKSEGKVLVGQLTEPGLATMHVDAMEGKIRKDLHFIVPRLQAGQSLKLSEFKPSLKIAGTFVSRTPGAGMTEIAWQPAGEQPIPVLRYMHAPYDDSTKASRDLTYKVFHHLFDPSGKRLVTNGGPTGLFPHHRGLMFGFNRITYGKNKKADTWHCPPPVYVEHVKFTNQQAGPVLGRQRALIAWHGDKKTIFAEEERELTVYRIPGGTLVDFATRLSTVDGPVKLDGDPQHAGFQFRADKEVAEKSAKQTYYLRPDGKGKPGETRNWEPKSGKGPVNLPWNAMSFVLGDERYTGVYMDHPQNPGERRYSERDYGRFGCYFEYEVTKDNPLLVKYRFWLQVGEMTGEQVQAMLEPFIHPPQIVAK